MVILFLTTGLEPGKDGVGDYTRLLAAECIRRGQTCYLMALNDSFVSQPVEASELVDGVEMPILRLPATLSWKERARLAVDFQAWRPVDWVSLQFVCYGFNPKGMVWNLAGFLEAMIGNHPLHVMFHETWIGIDKDSSFKARILGGIQRHFIRKLFHRLKPRLVTTSIKFYVAMLRDIGFSAIELPLFGNIPIRPRDNGCELPGNLIQAGICDRNGVHPDRLVGLFFGTFNPYWKAEPFMQIMASGLQKNGKRACLISAGRQGGPGKSRWEELRKKYSPTIDFIALGECTPAQVSALMHLADFGVANTAWHLLGKSGSTTAMLDHGLPVIVTGYDLQESAAFTPSKNPLVHFCDETLEDKLWKGLPRRPAHDSSIKVAEEFIDHLMKLSETRS
jgi:hypothetical protein